MAPNIIVNTTKVTKNDDVGYSKYIMLPTPDVKKAKASCEDF